MGDQAVKLKKQIKSTSLDEHLLAWITLKRQNGHPVTDPEVKGKAMELNARTNGPANFVVRTD